jgi:hypothetical protein
MENIKYITLNKVNIFVGAVLPSQMEITGLQDAICDSD